MGRTWPKFTLPFRRSSSIRFPADGGRPDAAFLRPGSEFVVDYDPGRLRDCRQVAAGAPAWSIVAFAQFFAGNQEINPRVEAQIAPATSGASTTIDRSPFSVTVPAEATRVELWFHNTGDGGCCGWDSRYGQNYRYDVSKASVWNLYGSPPWLIGLAGSLLLLGLIGLGARISLDWPVASPWLNRTLIACAAIAVAASIVVVLWQIPKRQLAGWRDRLQPNEQVDAETAAREGLSQLLAGLVGLVGIYFLWGQLNGTNESLRVNQQGQLTDRFTRAVEQLANKEQFAVRLGGIYALERIAADAPETHHWAVMEVLTTFVRESVGAGTGLQNGKASPVPPSLKPPADVQATLTVIGRRNVGYDVPNRCLDLRRAALSGANLANADLRHFCFGGADLSRANLQGADLSGSDLGAADLVSAYLGQADLTGAVLLGTDFRRAYLGEAVLTGAKLKDADLRGADLRRARGLTQEQIDSAVIDEQTQLPEGFRTPPASSTAT